MNLKNTLHTQQQRLQQWLRDQRPLSWLDGLTSEFDSWKPDPPVWERLIR